MNPQDCPYARRVTEDHVTCEKFCEAAGFGCALLHVACDIHEKAGGPEVPIEAVPNLRARLLGFLRARIGGGDCAHYKGRLDLDDAFARFAARSTKQEQGELLIKAVEHWIGVGKRYGVGESGGHSDELIEQKAAKIAKDHGLEDALAGWAESMTT